ncbi:unnamed protein product [Microthlaspi erraticum]|uniref:Response regulatory domain-containing protein n=1 Tax=Microthlaspi erraticum TaxID=1685480 RepID=A0A6D2IYP9_9BRAS|nr:unnamed protein product [Microthlaspi erraticum]
MEFPVGMRVLAVDENPICLRKLESMLLLCKYHVTKTTDSKEALEMLREKNNMFDLVIADADLPDTDGFRLLEIGIEMGLPVIMLSQPSSKEILMKATTRGAVGYLAKPVGLSELQNILQHVVKKKNINKDATAQQLPPCESHPAPSYVRKRSRRALWTMELHEKFVNAVEQLGHRGVPKNIQALMNVEGLTRENVASHLQIYRLCMRKVEHPQNPINSPEVNNA